MAQAKHKKRFFDVEIPIINKTTQLIGFTLNDVDKRTIKYDLTRILRGKNILLYAKVKVSDDKAIATPNKLKVLPSFLKRMVRKGTDYIEDSFSTKCKDSEIKIKTLLVTRRKVSRAVKNALREKTKKELIDYLKNKNTEQIFDEILKNQLQKELSLKLKKIYPLSLCEIRWLEVLEKKE